MSRQRMQVAEEVLKGSEIRRTDPWQVPLPPISEFIKNVNTVRVNGQVAHDILWTGDKDYYVWDTEMGPIIPQFPNMWIEFNHSGTVKMGGNWVEVPDGGASTALAVQEMDRDYVVSSILNKEINGRLDVRIDGHVTRDTSLSGIHTVFALIPYSVMNKAPGIVVEGIPSVVCLDKAGKYTQHMTLNSDELIYQGPGAETIMEVTGMDVLEAALALSVMNCRNVTLERSGPIQYRQTSKEKRARVPRLEYKTITLPGGAYVSQPGKGGPGAAPLHRVRGHFKTYTAEAPLMGKHVGTYWWGWQVRGKSENGVRVSDYKLGVPS